MTRPAALVVGGARGPGRAVAIKLAEAGADIAVCDAIGGKYRTLEYGLATPADLEETLGKIRATGRTATAVRFDVRDPDATAAGGARAESEIGPPTQLVLAAGVVSVVPIVNMVRAQWEEVVATNLT